MNIFRFNATTIVFCLSVLILPIAYANNDNAESVENIASIAKNYVLKNITIDTGETLQVDPVKSSISNKLIKCASDLRVEFPEGYNHEQVNAVQLSCDAPTSWRIMVPVNVSILTNVVMAKHTISSQQVITEDDLEIASSDRTKLYNGYFSDKEKVLGMMSKTTISAGMILTKKSLQQPSIVHRNDVIDLIAKNNLVTVSMKGVARSEGGLHDMIKAYNPSSKKTMDAIVIGQGRVEVVS
jgi:flagella basal body P-ring formation protein FlgA